MEDFFTNSHLTHSNIQPLSQKSSPFGLPKVDSKEKVLKSSSKTNTITNYFQGKTTPKTPQKEIIANEDKENKMTLEEAIVQLQAAKTMEEEKAILDSKEDLIEEEEEEDDLVDHKEFKEDTTQDSRRDKSKTEEINKLEEVLEEIKEMQDQICHLEPIGCKKTPRQNSQREKKNPSYFHDEVENEIFSEDGDNAALAGIKSLGPRKFQAKKQQVKDYNELVGLLQHLHKFDWLDGSHFSQKLTGSKFFSPSVIWFMICGNYFPRNLFANKNPKEAIHQRLEKLKGFMPDVPERITKNDLKNEIINKNNTNEHETIFLDNFHNDIKAYSSSNLSNDYLKRTMSARAVTSMARPAYTSDDDEWLAKTRHFIFESYQNLQGDKPIDMEIEAQDPDVNLLAKMDIQNLIDLYEKELYQSNISNEKVLEDLEKKVLEGVETEEIMNRQKYDAGNSLLDLKVDFPEDENFIGLLEKKQNESKELEKKACLENGKETVGGKSAYNSKFKPKILVDDMVCFVCNDGDYTDEDLIVFCSRCNMSVHQGCYGIPTIPEGDWICDVCLNFEENGKYLRCPLCDKRGGAMKPSHLRADTDLFENLNPGYDAFLKSYANPEFMKNNAKTKYLSVKDLKDGKKHHEGDRDDASVKSNEDSDDELENLYYDIQFIDDNFKEEELVNEPKPAHVWTHLTCALFIPEVYFSDLTYMTNIIGLENIPKERFKIECTACGLKRGGAIANCEKGACKKAFHPECARRAKYFLDVRENEIENKLLYHIFCEKHTPLKLRRTLESKEKKMKEEIHQFFKLVEKYCHNMTNNAHNNHGPVDPVLVPEKVRRCEKREDTDYFMSLVEKYREITAKKPCVITLETAFEEENEDGNNEKLYNILNISLPKANFTKERKLTVEDEIWGVLPYKNYTPEQKYKKYRKICSVVRKESKAKEVKLDFMRKNLERARQMRQTIVDKKKKEEDETKAKNKTKATKLNKNDKRSNGRFLKKRVLNNVNNLGREEEEEEEVEVEKEEDLGILYCVCKKKYGGELMTACDGCGEWFHPGCMNFPEETKMDRVTWWWCKKCCKKKGYKDEELRFEEKKGNKKVVYSKKIDEDEFEMEEPDVEKKMKKK